MTIFSVVMTAVYAGFNTGAKVWKRGERDMRAFQAARVALALMSKELRCAFPEAGHLFFGENKKVGRSSGDRIEFFTVRPPLEPGKGEAPMILKVAYYVEGARGGRSRVLKRDEQIVRGPIPAKKEVKAAEARRVQIRMDRVWSCVIAENLESLDFQYSWGRRWSKSCKYGFGLPAVVRITLDLGDEEQSAAPKRFATAVSIPLGPGEGPRRGEQQDDRSRRQRRL